MVRGLIFAGVLTGGALLGVLVLREAPEPVLGDEAPVAPSVPASPTATPTPRGDAAPSAEDARAAAEAYAARFGVGADVRAYADGAASMSAAERERRADALLAAIDAAEADGVLAGQQAPYLRGALAAARFADDPARRDAALAEIAAAEAARRAALPPIDHGPAFARYKRREAEIVAQVQERTTFPDGLTRSEYLRRELDRARIEAYGE